MSDESVTFLPKDIDAEIAHDSILDILPSRMAYLVKSLPDDLINRHEDDLISYLFGSPAMVPPVLNILRDNLWLTYETVQRRANRLANTSRKIKLHQIFKGTCTPEYFTRVIEDPKSLAYLICPPFEYISLCRESLSVAIKKIREALNCPITLPDGRTDVKYLNWLSGIYEKLDQRVHGAIVQRIDQRSINVNVSKELPPTEDNQPATSLREIEDKIHQLEAQSRQLSSPPSQPLDVVATLLPQRIDHER